MERKNIVASAILALVGLVQTQAQAGSVVFVGLADEEPLRIGYLRDTLVARSDGYRLGNGDAPYKDWYAHTLGPGGYDDTWPNFHPELVSDIYPNLAAKIGSADFVASITLHPHSAALEQHSERQGQRFGLYLQFDGGTFGTYNGKTLNSGSYVIFGFDADFGPDPDIPPGNRPFALVGGSHWSYYVQPFDATGTAETLTLERRGDIYTLSSSSRGTTFIGVAGQRDDGAVYVDLNGPDAIKPKSLADIGSGRDLTAIALWTESFNETPFPADAGLIQSIAVESPGIDMHINSKNLQPGRTRTASLAWASQAPRSVASSVGDEAETASDLAWLHGEILDAETRQPIDYAHVTLRERPIGDDQRSYTFITQADGRYRLRMAAGDYQLEATAKGYHGERRAVETQHRQQIDFVLQDIGRDHHVGKDYVSIQAALDAANDGDVVHLAAGEYNESLTLVAGVAMRGAGAESTKITGDGYRDVALRPFVKEWFPPYGAAAAQLKMRLPDVELAAFTLDPGTDDYPIYAAEDIGERLAMLVAVDEQDVAAVRRLLAANPRLATTRFLAPDGPPEGSTYLMRNTDPWGRRGPTFERDNIEIARLLVAAGADANETGGQSHCRGGTPLHCAAWNDNSAMVRFLLVAGADPNALVRERSPLNWAFDQGQRTRASVFALIDGGARYTLLDLVAMKSFERLQRELGDRVNQLFPVHRSAPTSLLHVAVRSNFADVAAWLVERGADPTLEDANGLTPIDVLADLSQPHPALAKALGIAAPETR